MENIELQNLIPWILLFAFIGYKIFASKKAGEAIKEITAKGDYQLIDVRSPEEYQSFNIPGSHNIPIDQFSKHIEEIDTTKPVIVYCASGMRSSMACGQLRSKGYQHVVNGGGIQNVMNSI